MRKQPLINWEALAELFRPMPAPPEAGGKTNPMGPKKGYGGWDNQANFYNQMAQMEAGFTLNQLNCFDTSPEDTVLDVGCGPGRISVPMAKRAKSVTSLDASPKMLECCMENAKKAGVNNIQTKLFDWLEEPIDSLEKHDIVIASRSVGMQDIHKLSSLAKKYAVIVIWAFGYPSIPEIVGKLFKGTVDHMPGPPAPGRDRRLGNNLFYNRIYDLGYNPNLNIVEDGFTKIYDSKDEAYEDLKTLRPDLPEEKMDIFKSNLESFLTERQDGTIEFLAKTKSLVLWWKPEIEE